MALKRHTLLARLCHENSILRGQKSVKKAFLALKGNVKLSRHEKMLKAKSEDFRVFNLKIKAWTVLIQYFQENETRFYTNSLLLSSSEIEERTGMVSLLDMAERKRISFLFDALKYGITQRSKAINNKSRAYDHLGNNLLRKSFLTFKWILARKRKIRHRMVRLRKIHY